MPRLASLLIALAPAIIVSGCVSLSSTPGALANIPIANLGDVFGEAYDERAQEVMVNFRDVVLRGTIAPKSSHPDVSETAAVPRVRLARESATAYDAQAVMDELVDRHTAEAEFYRRAICRGC